MSLLLVRERAPLRLAIDIAAPDGHHARWALDEHQPANVPGSLTFSDTMPGGYEQASNILERLPEAEYADLEDLSTATIRGAGGDIAWQGRLEKTPRQSGDQSSITPSLVGWQAHLDDDSSAREIYIDSLYSSWIAASIQRKINLLSAAVDNDDAAGGPDYTSGQPALVEQITGAWSREHTCEAWYDAKGLPLGSLYYAWKIGASISSADTNWSWAALLLDDDVASAYDNTGSLRAAGPNAGTLAATTATRRWALAQLAYAVAAGSDGVNYPLYWTALGVYGNHGLPKQGAGTATQAPGLLGSDIVANAVGRWAPKLAYTTGPNGTIRPSTFVIPQFAFTDPTTTGAIVKAITVYDLQDWAVWDGPTFYWAPRGAFGRNWRARVYPAKLAGTGPQVSRLFNGVVIQFTDVAGITRTVGPPASGAQYTDSTLLDTDPQNPANQSNIKRYAPLQAQTMTAPAAIKVGAVFLAEQKLLDTSGQATLVGHVEDDHGVLWPAWMVKAGDAISFVDAHDPSPRRVVRKSYDDATKTASVDLDAPPDGLAALLQRLQLVIQPLGF